MILPCYYALGGINFKNGYATSCPQQSDQLQILDEKYLPSEFYNNESFKKHRLDLMKGIWPQGCDMCMRVEKNNSGKSMRQEEPVKLNHFNFETGEVEFAGLKTVEIRFSHSCNMACLHCSQVFSSGWMSKLKRYQSDEEDKQYKLDQLTGVVHRKSPDDDLTISISTERALEIVEDLNLNFPNLERVDFAGGEVLYQKQFIPTLKKLAEHPNARTMMVMFHSNFNADFDPVELSDCLKKFGRVKIQISVDAGPRLYPYFRQGSWTKLKQNIDAFKSVNQGKTEINLVCTTSAYQLMEIKDIFVGFLSLDVNFINASIVFTPEYINPSIMMYKFKDEVLQDIEETAKTIDEIHNKRKQDVDSKNLTSYNKFLPETWTDIESARDALSVIKKYILHNTFLPTHWEAFKVYIRKSDSIWKQNFNDHIQNYKYVNGDIVRNV